MTISKQIRLVFVIILCFSFASFNTFSQKTPEEIYEKYYVAIGGKDKLLKIKTLTIRSEFYTANSFTHDLNNSKNDKIEWGNEALKSVDYKKTPNKSHLEIYTKTNQRIQKIIYKNSKGYSYDSLDNKHTQDSVSNFIFANDLLHRIIEELYYNELEVKSTLDGIEKINGEKTYRILCKFNGIIWYNFYSIKNGLKLRRVCFLQNNQTPLIDNFSNYKEVDGIKFPFPNFNKPTNYIKSINYSIKINETIDDNIFNF